MTWKDKLEIGLKDDAPFRRDNLPDFQQRTPGVPKTKPSDPTRSPEVPGARAEAVRKSGPHEKPRRRPTRRPPVSERARRPKRHDPDAGV